jgi:hypothetical protein
MSSLLGACGIHIFENRVICTVYWVYFCIILELANWVHGRIFVI